MSLATSKIIFQGSIKMVYKIESSYTPGLNPICIWSKGLAIDINSHMHQKLPEFHRKVKTSMCHLIDFAANFT